jgi:hypothetical protein
MSRRSRHQERGASAIEFAIVVPVLLMIVFGIISFGFAMAQKATIASAVRSGARFGSVNLYAGALGAPHKCENVIERTRDQATTIGLSSKAIKVTVAYQPEGNPKTEACKSEAGSLTVTGAKVGKPPCEDSSAVNPGKLYVQADYTGELSIPLAGVLTSLDLGSTGTYSCEYK